MFVRARVRSCAAGGDLVVRARTARGEKAGIARGVRMRRFKHIWERRENRRSSASAAHLERLGLREHEPFLLGERGDRLLFLGRGRLLLLGGHRAAEGAPRAPECGGKEDSASQNERELTCVCLETRMAFQSPKSDSAVVRVYEDEFRVQREMPIRACPFGIRGRTRRGGVRRANAANRREPPRTRTPSRRTPSRP